MQNNVIRHSKSQVVLEVLNAVSHGISFFLGIFLTIILLVKASRDSLGGAEIFSLAIYSAAVLLLYLASTLFHCLVFTKASRVFQIFDHSNIYLLIAGTYTPYCVIFMPGIAGVILLTTVWILAVSGIILHIISKGKHQKIETTIYVAMGWLCMFLGKALYSNLSLAGFWLLVSGGIVFTLGALIYSFSKIPGMHLIWHFFVMAGTLLMFLSIYLNI